LHYKPQAGIKNFTRQEAALAEADHATRDLFNHLASGKEAIWDAYYQLMPQSEAAKYKWNIFDVTKIWPHSDYPLQPYGKLVLNRNPANYFAETEQAAFSPGHLIPGIEPSPDRMLQGRLFSYPDTHRHRLGANYTQIPINCPYSTKVNNQQRDGPMTFTTNGASEANYEPNSVPGTSKQVPTSHIKKFYVDDWAARHPQNHPNCDYEQVGSFYRKVLSESDRNNLISNIVESLSHARTDIQQRMVAIFSKVDPEYGKRVAEGTQKENQCQVVRVAYIFPPSLLDNI